MNNLYLAAICATTGLGRAKLPTLIQKLGGAKAVFEADAKTLLATGLYREDAVQRFLALRDLQLPAKLAAFCKREGVQLVSLSDAAYPDSLRQINDPPLVLYVKGSLPQVPYAVAIVGSRDATPYGVRVAQYFAKALTHEKLPIISGGARGIDTAAHEACLKAGGKTVAVLGCGIDVAYPAGNKPLFNAIVAAGGAVVTEYPPATPPINKNFPARNRIIVGLARAVLVAEAGVRSGAVITANIAADEGRDVYCVPSNIFDRTSIGCHDLIRNGAKLVDTVQDILEDKQRWHEAQRRKICQPSIFDCTDNELQAEPAIAENVQPRIQTTELGSRLLELLRAGAQPLESLTEKSGASFAAVSMELLDLQVAGLVAVDQAQRYYRK